MSLGLPRILLFGLLSVSSALASGPDPICSKYVESRGYQKFSTNRSGARVAGDTVYWETRVLPDFERIAQDPKFQTEAALNSKFKAMLSAYGLRENEISGANQNRLISDCKSQPALEGCLAMQTYCVRDYIRTKLPRAAENFIGCLDPVNRANGCGEAFQTPEGISKNLDVLKNFEAKIGKLDDELLKKPNVPEYLTDIESTFQDFSAKVQAALAQGKKKVEQLKAEQAAAANRRYEDAKKQANALGQACRAFDECKGYLARQDRTDSKQLLNQISSCQIENVSTSDSARQFDATMATLKEVQSAAQKKALHELAKDTFDESLSSTARQYLEGFYSVNGELPSESQFCDRFGKCADPKIRALYKETKEKRATLPRMDIAQEISAFNSRVRVLNQACASGKVEDVNAAHQQLLYASSLGGLLAIQKFSDKVGAYNQDDCFEDGKGMKELDPKADVARVRDSLNEMVAIVGDKGRELTAEKKDLVDPEDPGEGIRYFLEYDPLVLRELIRKTNNPEQAMLLCQAIEKIYAKEASRKMWSNVLTGVSIAGALVATVLTGGAASPLLIAAVAGTALGVGTINSMVSIHTARVAEQRYEQSNATGSVDRGMAQSLIDQYGMESKAETVGLALQFVPGVGRVAGKAVSRTVIQPALRSELVVAMTKAPAWKAAGAMTKPAALFFDGLKAGTAKFGDMAVALASKTGPKTSQVMVGTFNAITKGMSEDAAMIFAASALTHPDPYSEAGLEQMLEAFVKSRGLAALGGAGGKIYAQMKAKTRVAAPAPVLADRRVLAEKELGLADGALSQKKADAVNRAHLIGEGEAGYGTYTKAQLLQKRRILLDAGFSETETTTLLRRGVAGSETPGGATPELVAKTYQKTKYTPESLATVGKRPVAELQGILGEMEATLRTLKNCASPECKKAFRVASADYEDIRNAGYFSQGSKDAKEAYSKAVPKFDALDLSAGGAPSRPPLQVEAPTSTESSGSASASLGKRFDAQRLSSLPKTFQELHRDLPELQAQAARVKTSENPVNMDGVQVSIHSELGKISDSRVKLEKSVQAYTELAQSEKSMSTAERAEFEKLRSMNETRKEILADLNARERVLVTEQSRISQLQGEWKATVVRDPAVYVNSLGSDRGGTLLRTLEVVKNEPKPLTLDATERLLQSVEGSIKSGKYKFDSLNETDRADAALLQIATREGVDLRFFPEVKARLEKAGLGPKWTPPAKSRFVDPKVESELIRAHAEAELGRPLSDSEAKVVYDAHLAGRFQLGKDGKTQAMKGNYSEAQLREKTKQLRSVFSEEESGTLLRKGVAGDSSNGFELATLREAALRFPKNPRDIPAWRAEFQVKVAEEVRLAGVSDPKSFSGSRLRNLEKQADRERAGQREAKSEIRYTNPGHHDIKSPHFRGGGAARTSVLPGDAEKVFRKAAADPDQRTWWGVSCRKSGPVYYRYQLNGKGSKDVHWNGMTGPGENNLKENIIPGAILSALSSACR